MMRSALCQCFMLVALFTLLLFLTALWLPHATDQECALSWQPCVSLTTSKIPPTTDAGSDISSHSNLINILRPALTAECPGRSFQVSRLLLYLNSALRAESDVLIEPYLLCWEELIKFMEALGPLVSFFTYKVQEKITLIRRLAEEDSGKVSSYNPHGHAYHSVRSMLEAELQRGVVGFERETPSGSRTLLRLHRSLLWLQLLLEKLWAEPWSGGRSLGEVCDDAYSEALAPYHPWLLQRAARIAFRAMPDHMALLDIVCVTSQQEAEPVIHIIVTTIKEVRRRTHIELEKRNMLELP